MTMTTNRWRALAARWLDMTGGGGGVISTRLHNTLFALFLGGILTYGGAFAWHMLASFNLINLIRDVNGDDSFYYFQIASNLAKGKFSTFDGGITRTNGYHPIWLFLITPFYWVFDKETALFGIKAFEIMLTAGGVALVAVAARLARLPWILLLFALPASYQMHALFKGLEAAAALFMLGLLILALCLYARNPARYRWLLVTIAFALPWVRLEYVAISLAATAALCLIEWSWQGRPRLHRSRSIFALKAVVPSLAAAAGILAYFAYNKLVFGGLVPVSGATKQVWSQIRFGQEGGYSFARNFRDVLQIYVFDYEWLVALEVCAYLLLVWWSVRRSKSQGDWLLLAFLVGVFGLAAGHLAKFAQTVLTIHPAWGRYDWYFVPAYLMMALIVPLRCFVAIHLIHRFIGARLPKAANIVSAGIVIFGAAFLLEKADFTYPFRYVDGASESSWREWETTSYMGVQVMDHLLPEDSVIGSWDAGVIGYFSRFPVVNLDGLANSYDYHRVTTGDPDRYIRRKFALRPFYRREFRITHLANAMRAEVDFDNTLFAGASYPDGSNEIRFKLVSFQAVGSADSAAWFWERMEPHFAYSSDDIGVLVDGRLAQVFVRNGAPDELIVWSWVGQREEMATKAKDCMPGLCVDALVLPHDALPPVRVEAMTASDYLAKLVGDHQPIIQSEFDVYLTENRLIYVKEQCVEVDTAAKFFLHPAPVDVNDLPGHRKQHGFDNLDFSFGRYGAKLGGICLAKVPLPQYDIAEIRTGQYVPGEGRIWEGSFMRAPGKMLLDGQWRFGGHLYVGEQFIGYFEDGFDGWLPVGEAVVNHAQHEHYKGQQPISGNTGQGFLTSYHPDKGDRVTGRALSPAFTAEPGQYLTFLIAGGEGGGVGLRLLADGDEVAVWRGRNTERFRQIVHPLADVAGERLQLELFDDETGGWGHIMLDHVMLTRRSVEDLPQWKRRPSEKPE